MGGGLAESFGDVPLYWNQGSDAGSCGDFDCLTFAWLDEHVVMRRLDIATLTWADPEPRIVSDVLLDSPVADQVPLLNHVDDRLLVCWQNAVSDPSIACWVRDAATLNPLAPVLRFGVDAEIPHHRGVRIGSTVAFRLVTAGQTALAFVDVASGTLSAASVDLGPDVGVFAMVAEGEHFLVLTYEGDSGVRLRRFAADGTFVSDATATNAFPGCPAGTGARVVRQWRASSVGSRGNMLAYSLECRFGPTVTPLGEGVLEIAPDALPAAPPGPLGTEVFDVGLEGAYLLGDGDFDTTRFLRKVAYSDASTGYTPVEDIPLYRYGSLRMALRAAFMPERDQHTGEATALDHENSTLTTTYYIWAEVGDVCKMEEVRGSVRRAVLLVTRAMGGSR